MSSMKDAALAGLLLRQGHPPGTWSPAAWHSHEMVYGYAVAVICGLLLTSARVWTGRETVYGAKLLAVVALWLLARVAMLVGEPWKLVAVLDIAFLPVVAFALFMPVIASANWRNLGFLILLLALALINTLWHLAPHTPVLAAAMPVLAQLSIDGVVLVILIVGGRIIPAFTGNAVGRDRVRSSSWFDVASVIVVGASMLLNAAFSGHAVSAAIIIFGGTLILLRQDRWAGSHTLGRPIL